MSINQNAKYGFNHMVKYFSATKEFLVQHDLENIC